MTAAPAGADPRLRGTYALASELTVTKDGNLAGDGAATTILDGGSAHRILNATGHALSLRGLTLRNGTTSGGADGGAVIAGALTIEYCVFTGNAGGAHGGAAFGSDSATARHSTLSGTTRREARTAGRAAPWTRTSR